MTIRDVTIFIHVFINTGSFNMITKITPAISINYLIQYNKTTVYYTICYNVLRITYNTEGTCF